MYSLVHMCVFSRPPPDFRALRTLEKDCFYVVILPKIGAREDKDEAMFFSPC